MQSEQIQKHFCFRNKCSWGRKRGKICFRDIVFSFAGKLRARSIDPIPE